jgi:ABC-type Zn2+ transport system substrate-binding protein/surface adhesin
MVKPMPEGIKALLGELSASQQVTLKGYIGTLRAEIKDLEEQLRSLQDPDPHAHYHDHEKCTVDHGHEHDHDDEGHDHKHGQ